MSRALLLAAVWLAGCSTGKKISQEDLAQIEFGSTRASWLLQRFGKPNGETEATNEGGFYSRHCGHRAAPLQVWTYQRVEGGLTGKSLEVTSFMIDEQGRVCRTMRQKAGT